VSRVEKLKELKVKASISIDAKLTERATDFIEEKIKDNEDEGNSGS